MSHALQNDLPSSPRGGSPLLEGECPLRGKKRAQSQGVKTCSFFFAHHERQRAIPYGGEGRRREVPAACTEKKTEKTSLENPTICARGKEGK